MTRQVKDLLPALDELAKIAPNEVNHALLLEVVDRIMVVLQVVLPPKHCGFTCDGYLYVALYQDLTQLAFKKFCPALESACSKAGIYFQKVGVKTFANGKHRRAVPGQPDMSRFLAALAELGIAEEFSNALLLGTFLYAKALGLVNGDLTLIADYVKEPCQKNKEDPYCFGSKNGKTCHKTLTFSVISNDLHLVVANYKIQKRQPVRPLFGAVITRLHAQGVEIRYGLFDRGFYRRELLAALKQWKITVIMPARNCADTRGKVHLWVQGLAGRSGTVAIKVRYAKKHGWVCLRAGIVLCTKRGYSLKDTKKQYNDGTLSLDKAGKRVFPLLVIRGSLRGLKALRGNENYIRQLYRERWAIEIAFRQTHLLGISSWVKGRDARLVLFSWKCAVYNLWQIARAQLAAKIPAAEPLTLDEFCGRMWENRTNGLEACAA